ncbi:MAG: type I polyketide synthase [Acidobacteriota bacterium]
MSLLPTINHEPIAIIGLGCRFPGANSPADFWQLLINGVDAITEVPSDRFDIDAYYDPNPATPGKIVTRYGGFLEQVDKFDPYFFSISPREAGQMDPQQRVLLEVAWEALEDAGQLPEKLIGSQAGVFIGMITNDYEDLQIRDIEGINIYSATGSFRSVASGRLSYILGLQGPSLTIDTACSSSLVTVHLACQSLRSGECELAIAGGVNLILQPEHSFGFSSANMLAPNGRCKFCDANADGFIRSEGVGIVVLKPLSQALADKDPIYALIMGSAVNNDGRSSGFLMTPSQQGQEAVVRAAYRDAKINPGQVHYVEAHGTGTKVGDPIELSAIGTVIATERPSDSPCFIGSVKTNIGHSEAAAGIAGLIKVALSIKHRLIPPSLHLHEPNPNIPWQQLPFIVNQNLVEWPAEPKPARAGVSSFGISGTNAHVVLQEAPSIPYPYKQTEEVVSNRAQVLTISAKSTEALQIFAQHYQAFVTTKDSDIDLTDICYTSSIRRTHHEHRLALVANSRTELARQLETFLSGESGPGIFHYENPNIHEQTTPKCVFVFPGQGSQWFGMGRTLLEQEPIFRKSLESCEKAMQPYVDWSLLNELIADQEHSRLNEIDVIQPILFALQVSLVNLWRAWGIEPAAVIGHSMGEVAASYVAGILSLEDAAKIICRRSRLLKRMSGQGAMALVELSLVDARLAIAGYEDRLAIAVSNSPTSTVLSGDPTALGEVLEQLRRRDIFCRLIKVDVASHSPQMDLLREDLLQALTGLQPNCATIPIYSTVTGMISDGLEFDASYWVRNLREAVLFATATERLRTDGYNIFIEISPNPILLPAIQQNLHHLNQDGIVLPSMRREEEERTVMLGTLSTLYTSGYQVDWSRLFPQGGKCVPLPNYPWQRERFWMQPTTRQYWIQSNVDHNRSHPLLNRHWRSAINPDTHFWETELSTKLFPYLNDHCVHESIIFPAAAYVEMALAAVSQVLGPGCYTVENLEFKKALFLSENESNTVQSVLSLDGSEQANFQLFSLAPTATETASTWILHATGTVRIDKSSRDTATQPCFLPQQIQERCQQIINGQEHYQNMRLRGLHYGPYFQGIEQIWQQNSEAIGRVNIPERLLSQVRRYHIHPALLDICFQVMAALLEDEQTITQGTYLPVALDSLSVYEHPNTHMELWCYALLHKDRKLAANRIAGDLFLIDKDGRVLMEAGNLCLQQLESDAQVTSKQNVQDWLYRVDWQLKTRSIDNNLKAIPTSQQGQWLIFTDTLGVGQTLKSSLEAHGEVCCLVSPGDTYKILTTDHYQINPALLQDYYQLLTTICGTAELPLRGIVHLWSLAIGTSDAEEATRLLPCSSVMRLIQALAELEINNAPHLWLVTQGSQAVAEQRDLVSIWQAPLWGLARVIAQEHPELHCTRVDLSAQATTEEIQSLFTELWSDSQEVEVALRGNARYCARLTHYLPQPSQSLLSQSNDNKKICINANEQSYRLEIHTPGILDNLTLRPITRRKPASGEIEIQLHAAGIIFRDVMMAMGLLPPLADDGHIDIGWEAAGKVVAVGTGVENFHSGDEVIAVLSPHCLGNFATTPAILAVHKPTYISFVEAAAIPISFLTAYYALCYSARISAGEKILIHAATGGVGLAAIQIAKMVGAEIFATAGSEEKRAFLHSLGIEHILDSRSLDFADEILHLTNGNGVDIVLNSLSGEAIPKSLAILAPHGRFLELGKTDILQNRALGLKHFQNNISFFAVDFGQILLGRTQFLGSMLQEIMPYFDKGFFKPLPVEVFLIGEAANAFRHLAQAKHIGKVVLSLTDREVLIDQPANPLPVFKSDATYLITGGLGALGLAVTQWMIEQGASHFVLIGRNDPSHSTKQILDTLTAAGAQIKIASADVTNREQIANVLGAIKRSMPPLKGVIHAAAILDDGLLLNLTDERLRSVMAPKIDGAWNLHTLTLNDSLDFFVLFSSVATLLGSPGQANYSAANAFLDALAHYRQAQGQAALSINWGPWAEIGLAARPDRGGRLALRGVASLTPAQGIKALELLLADKSAQIGVMPFNFEHWRRFYTASAETSFFAELAAQQHHSISQAATKKKGDDIRAALLAITPGRQRRLMLETYLKEQIAQVLKLSPTRIDPNKPLGALGLDSLMALEFRNRLEASLAQPFSTTMVWNYPTIVALATHVASKIGVDLEPTTVTEHDADLEKILRDIEQLPDSEVKKILAQDLTAEKESYE